MELWDIYNSNGIKTGNVMKRGDIIKEGDYHLAAEVWIINNKSQILIQKRSENRKVLPGIWGMTTGCIVSREDSLNGCIREAHEEIGIVLLKDNLKKLKRVFRKDTIWDVYVIKQEYDLSKAKLQKEEVSDLKWVTVTQLKEMLSNSEAFEYPEIYEILSLIQNTYLLQYN
ncbi:NUDIX hydrolase [Clostridium uliginosum]|uniref:Isopentenyldiphosphate isomerase n=1 Tax=Clostridium uliginosum TaxID=119641 RepID=A0A1I1KT94_9CLOT|nr:NUDIX domain-containing protein [Clostridium uliginosum]SFC64027.1 Isopentenyldiphosphate isomerase [Clostridium uliginosum]